MRSSAFALAWEIWARHRWLHSLAGLYLVAVCLLGLLLPGGPSPSAVAGMMIPLLLAGLLVVGSAAHGWQSRLEAATSGIPGRLLVLPVPAWLLALVPFLAVTLIPSMASLLYTSCVIRTIHEDAPLFWPGLLFGTLGAWLLALTWNPFPLSWLRPWALIAVVAACYFGGLSIGQLEELPEPVIAAALLVQWPLAYAVTVRGVRAARRGERVGASWPAWLTEWRPSSGSRSFPSPGAALLWLEWRSLGWTCFFAAGVCIVGLLPLVCLIEKALTEKPFLIDGLGLRPVIEAVGLPWFALHPLLFLPLVLCLFSVDIGKTSLHKPGLVASEFLVVRPVTTGQIVRAKLLAAAQWLLLLWGVMLTVALGWAVVRGHVGEMAERVTALAGGSVRGAFLLACLLVALYARSWAHLAAGLWVGLTGRTWVVTGALLFVLALGVLAPVVGGLCVRDPEWRQGALRALPWVLGSLVLLKGVAVGLVFRALLRRGQATGGELARVTLAWALAACGLGGLVAWLVPAGVVPAWWLAAGVVLALPLARPCLAPLALAWNRHR